MKKMLISVAALTFALSGAASAGNAKEMKCPKGYRGAKCYTVKTPLDHAKPNGSKIELFVAVKPASDKPKSADPVFYLEGGPGAPSSVSVGSINQVFPNRDVVGIDQRGIGRSKPSLACQNVNDLNNNKKVKTSQVASLFIKEMTKCSQALSKKGIKLEYFNTTQAAKDIEVVRKALGYQKINLYGASYGTRLAQEVMRNSSDSLRSVVLDSVIPTSVDRVAHSPKSIQESLKKIFKACESQKDCKKKYPKLEDTYKKTLAKLAKKPVTITMKGQSTPLDAITLQSLVIGSMYTPSGIGEIPGMIVAARDGKKDVIESSTAVRMADNIADTLTWAAFYSNECPGEVAYSDSKKLTAALKAAPEFGTALSAIPGISSKDIFGLCRNMKLNKPAPKENEAVKSNVPTLLLAGEFDPVTPSSWLPQVTKGLSRNSSFVVKGASHGTGLTTQCGYKLVVQFMNKPTKKIDSGCVSKGNITFK